MGAGDQGVGLYAGAVKPSSIVHIPAMRHRALGGMRPGVEYSSDLK
jgi:hypothetical protein